MNLTTLTCAAARAPLARQTAASTASAVRHYSSSSNGSNKPQHPHPRITVVRGKQPVAATWLNLVPSASVPTSSEVPQVPTTEHMKPGDLALSSFFALHRPVSISCPIPPTTPSSESFISSLLSPPAPVSSFTSPPGHWQSLITPLPSTPTGGRTRAIPYGYFRRFIATPIAPKTIEEKVEQWGEGRREEDADEELRKMWKEIVDPEMVDIRREMGELGVGLEERLAISVKRQRKLKMKKHKYKKLMKKTRNLRRRIERQRS